MIRSRSLVYLAVSLILVPLGNARAQNSDAPNIVLVFMDNFGWGKPASMVEGSFEVPQHRGLMS